MPNTTSKDDTYRASLLSAYFDGKFSIEDLAKLSDKQAKAVDRVIDVAIDLIKHTGIQERIDQVEKLLRLDDLAGIPRFQGMNRSALERELTALKAKQGSE